MVIKKLLLSHVECLPREYFKQFPAQFSDILQQCQGVTYCETKDACREIFGVRIQSTVCELTGSNLEVLHLTQGYPRKPLS